MAFIPDLSTNPMKLAILAFIAKVQTHAQQVDPDGGFVTTESILDEMVKRYRRQPVQDLTELWKSDKLLETPHPENKKAPKTGVRIKPEVIAAWDLTLREQIRACKAAGDWPTFDDPTPGQADSPPMSTTPKPPIINDYDAAPEPAKPETATTAAAIHGVDTKALADGLRTEMKGVATPPPPPEPEAKKRGKGRPRKFANAPATTPSPDEPTDEERLTGKKASS